MEKKARVLGYCNSKELSNEELLLASGGNNMATTGNLSQKITTTNPAGDVALDQKPD